MRKEEEEDEDAVCAVCSDIWDLLERIERTIGMPKPDARRLCQSYGLARTERAYLQLATRLRAEKPGIRSPIGYLVSTLRKGMEWSREDLELHLRGRL